MASTERDEAATENDLKDGYITGKSQKTKHDKRSRNQNHDRR